MANNPAIQSILDKVATACTCDEKIYRNYRQTFQTIYSQMNPQATAIQRFHKRCEVNIMDAVKWGEDAMVSQCKLEIYGRMFGVIEHAILKDEQPSFYLSRFKQMTIEELCQYNGTSTSVLSNAVDHCRRLAIQQIFLGFHSDYQYISEILEREQEQA